MRRNLFFALVMLVAIAPVGCQKMAQVMVGMDEAYNSPERVAAAKSSTRTAILQSETVTGSTKQCFYDFVGSVYTKTIKSVEICPLSIKVTPP